MKEKKELIRYAAVCVVVLYLLFHYWDHAASGLGTLLGAVKPLLFGAAAAYILNMMLCFYERTILKKWKKSQSSRRAVSILLSMVTLFLILALIMGMVLPELKSCTELLIQSIPAAYQQIMDFLGQYPELQTLFADTQASLNMEKLINQLLSWLTSGAGASIFGYLSSVVSVFFNLFVAIIFAIYLLAGKEWLAKQLDRLIGAYLDNGSKKQRFYEILSTVNTSFHRFIVGQCTEAVILGTLCILGMLLLQLPYAVMIGVLVGATALIPIFGAYIGGIVGTVMIFTVSPWKAVVFVIFLVILQQLEGQLIYPRVVGTSIGLPGIFVFTSVMVGAALFGVPGVLLGVPLTAAAYQLLKQDLGKRTAK